MIGSVVRPQGLSEAAGGGASILGSEIECIANENVQSPSRVTAVNVPVGTSSPEVNHLPSGMIGGVVRPQLISSASIIRNEIEGITNEDSKKRATQSIAVSSTAVDVSHLPSGMVGGCLLYTSPSPRD